MKINANWIWKKQKSYNTYNQTIIAKKDFTLSAVKQANIIITADSYYRLYINNVWINDGPCRSWPEHFQYDQFDITSFLKLGNNEIKVVARYFGTGIFHRVPQQAGLLVQVNVKNSNGTSKTIVSDKSWLVAEAKQWISNTPKVSVQMEPTEYYDGRLETDLRFANAAELYKAGEGPWKGLNRRDVAYLTKVDFPPKTFAGAKLVKNSDDMTFCLSALRLCHQGVIEANHNTSTPCGMTSVISVKKKTTISIDAPMFSVTIAGKKSASGKYTLQKGKHLLTAMSKTIFGHIGKDKTLSINGKDFTLQNPTEKGYENPWSFILLKEFLVAKDDVRFFHFTDEDAELCNAKKGYEKASKDLLKAKDYKALEQYQGASIKLISSEKMFCFDSCELFQKRAPLKDAGSLVVNPCGMMADNPEITTIKPSEEGNIELLLDLGEQNCGYYSFELIADEGANVDIFGIEYITPSGIIQHSWGNRNGMRYITKKGTNKFTSLKRRSGRYIFITISGHRSAVKIRNFKLIESTYPVNYAGSFECSDPSLNKIWDISARTMKLCMEDTYTDCPLYEQTLWVGDARNESLFGYGVFGAYDLAARCIKLAAQSLEHFPIVGCQVPSSWECLLPAWSFLWGISVWDYYWHTGDERFLKKLWPAVIKNIKGAYSHINKKTGLFSGPFWNMFDWTEIDQDKKTVLHNSMLMVGAIDAAVKSANVLEDKKQLDWLKKKRKDLKKAINTQWDDKKKSYPDSIFDDLSPSNSICQHTSFLSILYDIIEKKNLPSAVANTIEPRKNMIRVGSPFAMLYYYETLTKIDCQDEIIKSIYQKFTPMLDQGATTVWETFSTGTMAFGEFPTRSHCHAWSSAPVYFLNKIILGIKQTSSGAKSFTVSPRLAKLNWAKGATATALGQIKMDWKKVGDKLTVNIEHPKGVKVKFEKNETMAGLNVKVTKAAV